MKSNNVKHKKYLKAISYELKANKGFTHTLTSFIKPMKHFIFHGNYSRAQANRQRNEVSVTALSRGGFTLVETLVAVAILATAIAAPTSIAQTGIRTARQARDGFTAQFLAAEAVELLRNTRDENVIDGDTWTSGLRVGTGEFRIDAVQELQSGNGIESCSGSCADDYIYFNPDTSLYSYDTGGEQTVFVRTVEVTQVHSEEISINVLVTWERPGRTYEFELIEHLFEW